MTKANKPKSSPSGAERRRWKRFEILETFSLFASVPAKGPLRLKVHDVSEAGMGFDLDIPEEGGDAGLAGSFKVNVGSTFEIHLYLNESLYLPLEVEVRRLAEKEGIRQIGGEFTAQTTQAKGRVALKAFVQFLDTLSDIAQIDS